jgi:hypothetical protein
MAVENLQIVEIIEVMENYLDKKRPAEEIRKKVDYTYKIEGQSVVIYEVRPSWDEKDKVIESGIAKATFVKSSNSWKVFWKRANGKWVNYPPQPSVGSLRDFLDLIEEDNSHCFWG